jgi:hypothetical protein
VQPVGAACWCPLWVLPVLVMGAVWVKGLGFGGATAGVSRLGRWDTLFVLSNVLTFPLPRAVLQPALGTVQKIKLYYDSMMR